MVDIDIGTFLWFALLSLAAKSWPVCLLAMLVAGFATAIARGWPRILFAAVAVLAASGAASGIDAWWRQRQQDSRAVAFEAATHSVLEAPATLDGLSLPPGTEIVWTDPAQAHIASAIPPQPVTVFGVQSSFISRESDGWSLRLDKPQPVDGWPCTADFIGVTTTGRLSSCRLATDTDWHGWPIPAGTLLEPLADGRLQLVLPDAPPVPAHEIGRPLPANGSLSMNADGSLDGVYIEFDSPLVVQGVPLWNSVHWHYPGSTLGQGRTRLPTSVTGALPADLVHDGRAWPDGAQVTVQTSDGAISAD